MRARILVVDDDVPMLRAISEMIAMRMEQVTVETCDSTAAALERITAIDYDVIVSDIKMPVMDGLKLMEQVLKIRPTTPTLLITGHGDHDLGVHALNAGAYAFIEKPIDRDFFVSWLKRALQVRQLSRTIEQQNRELERLVQERTAELEQANKDLRRTLSDRRLAEEAVRKSEERYRNLYESIDEGFCIIEVIFNENMRAVDYVFLEINPSFEKQTGIQDAQGRSMREIAPHHEEHWFELYGKIALSGESVRFEYPAVELRRWYEGYAYRLGEAQDRKVAIIFNDITERKMAEKELVESREQLRRVLEFREAVMTNMGEGLYTIDSDGLVSYVNPAAEALLGWKSEELLRRKMHDIIHYKHPDGSAFPAEECPGLQVLREGKLLKAQKDVFIRKGEEFFNVVYSSSPIRSADKIVGLVVVFRDV
jgi:PAS domain S-box-containing protein